MLVLAVGICVSGLLLHEQVRLKTRRYFAEESDRLKIASRAICMTHERTAHTIFEEIAANAEMFAMLREARAASPEQRGALRAGLDRLLAARRGQAQEQHVTLLTFHLPGQLEEQSYGARLVERLNLPMSGFDASNGAPGFRYLFPIFDHDNYLGCLEIGISFESIRDKMKELFMREMVILLRADRLGAQAASGAYAPSAFRGGYAQDTLNVFVHEGRRTIDQLNAAMTSEVAEHLGEEREFAVRLVLRQQEFLTVFVPLADMQRRHIGYFAAYSRDATIWKYHRSAYLAWAAISATLGGLLVAARTIRRHKAVIAEEETRFRLITHSIHDGLCVIDERQRMTFVNPAFERLLNVPRAELLGREFQGVLRYHAETGEQVEGNACPLFSAIAAGEHHASDQYWLVTRAHEMIPVSLTGSPMPVNSTRTGAVIVLHDMTHRKQAEEQLRRMNRQLEEASRYKSEFLAHMSHELRTPLTAMIGFTELAHTALCGAVEPNLLEHLQKAKHSAWMLRDLVNDVLDFSKIEAGKMDMFIEEVDFSDILDDVLLTAEGLLLNHPLALRAEISPNLPRLKTDYTKMKQILNNLLGNALKFTKEGHVAVRTTFCGHSRRIRVEIEDTGCGIPPQKLEHLFEAFTQGDRSITKKYGGTGLGLAITKKFCDALHIEISAISAVGKGTTFFLHIPLECSAAPELPRSHEIKFVSADVKNSGATAIRSRVVNVRAA